MPKKLFIHVEGLTSKIKTGGVTHIVSASFGAVLTTLALQKIKDYKTIQHLSFYPVHNWNCIRTTFFKENQSQKTHPPAPSQEGETPKNRGKVVKFVLLYCCFYKWEGSKENHSQNRAKEFIPIDLVTKQELPKNNDENFEFNQNWNNLTVHPDFYTDLKKQIDYQIKADKIIIGAKEDLLNYDDIKNLIQNNQNIELVIDPKGEHDFTTFTAENRELAVLFEK